MKLKIHSVVDLITNSSTVIFTYSEGSLPALKELVNEMLKTFGRTEKFDDIFYANIFLDESCDYIEYLEQNELNIDADEDVNLDYIEKLKHHILIGELEKPQWMIDAESYDYNYDDRPENTLNIIPAEEKYTDLADLLIRYLYSTDHEASYNG